MKTLTQNRAQLARKKEPGLGRGENYLEKKASKGKKLPKYRAQA